MNNILSLCGRTRPCRAKTFLTNHVSDSIKNFGLYIERSVCAWRRKQLLRSNEQKYGERFPSPTKITKVQATLRSCAPNHRGPPSGWTNICPSPFSGSRPERNPRGNDCENATPCVVIALIRFSSEDVHFFLESFWIDLRRVLDTHALLHLGGRAIIGKLHNQKFCRFSFSEIQ